MGYVFMLVNERFSIVTVTDLALEPWVAGRAGIEIKKKEIQRKTNSVNFQMIMYKIN